MACVLKPGVNNAQVRMLPLLIYLSAVKTKPVSKKKKKVFPEKSLLEIFSGED